MNTLGGLWLVVVFSEGLHQAIEAKEKVNIQSESQTLGINDFSELFSAI